MPNSRLVLKASVTPPDPAAVPPDRKVHLADLLGPRLEGVRPAAELEPTAPPEPPAPDRPQREPNPLQSAFLAENLNHRVAVYLRSGLKRVGTLKQFDSFTLWLHVPEGRDALVFRHLIRRIVPARRGEESRRGALALANRVL